MSEGFVKEENLKGLMSDDSGELFNLAGQRVNQSAKGIYIKNGRKVVIK